MDQVATMHKVIEMTGRVVDNIEPSQLDNPTPCTEWTVRDVLNHVTGGATMFGLCVRDGAVPDEKFGALMTGDNLGTDFKASFHHAADDAEESFAIPGAMDRIVKLPFGEMPAGDALNIAIFDVATHAVDLARATGQHVSDTELLEAALATGRQMVGPELRAPGVFGAEQPVADSASVEDRLLAFAGRKI
jgi:uncharacterized protein (TIGR03086 family)